MYKLIVEFGYVVFIGQDVKNFNLDTSTLPMAYANASKSSFFLSVNWLVSTVALMNFWGGKNLSQWWLFFNFASFCLPVNNFPAFLLHASFNKRYALYVFRKRCKFTNVIVLVQKSTETTTCSVKVSAYPLMYFWVEALLKHASLFMICILFGSVICNKLRNVIIHFEVFVHNNWAKWSWALFGGHKILERSFPISVWLICAPS